MRRSLGLALRPFAAFLPIAPDPKKMGRLQSIKISIRKDSNYCELLECPAVSGFSEVFDFRAETKKIGLCA